MSSLKEQLKRLAVPQNKLHLEGKKASLLFDQNDAVGLDREVIFDLAISGLNALIAINKTFSKYERLLFNKNQINYDRMLQTRDQNQNLNKIIKNYLIEVYPYFLTKPAQKTLEWLVYRYQINIFNIDDWLITIFCYHYSNMFVKVLTIIDLENSKKWNWLNNCAKSGTTLSKSVIINHCKKNSSFLQSVFGTLDEFVEVMGGTNGNLNLLFEHCNSIALSLLGDGSEVTEEIVSTLVQFSIRGLRSKCLIWETCCYTVLTSMASIITLTPDTVLLFCKLIAKYCSNELFKEGICCLNVIVTNQNQSTYPRNLLDRINLTEFKLLEIQSIMELFDLKPLLVLLENVDKTGFIKNMLANINMEIKEKKDDPLKNVPVSIVFKSDFKSCSEDLLTIFYFNSNLHHEENEHLISYFKNNMADYSKLKGLLQSCSEEIFKNRDFDVKFQKIFNLCKQYPEYVDKIKLFSAWLFDMIMEQKNLISNNAPLLNCISCSYLLLLKDTNNFNLKIEDKTIDQKTNFLSFDLHKVTDINQLIKELDCMCLINLIVRVVQFSQENNINIKSMESFSVQFFSMPIFKKKKAFRFLWKNLRKQIPIQQLISLYTSFLFAVDYFNSFGSNESSICYKDVEKIVSVTFQSFIELGKNDVDEFKRDIIIWFVLLSSKYQFLREASLQCLNVVNKKNCENFSQLVQLFINKKVEILSDPTVVLKLLSKIFTAESSQKFKYKKPLKYLIDFLNHENSSKKIILGVLRCLKLCKNDKLLKIYLDMINSLLDNKNDMEINYKLICASFECLNNYHPFSCYNDDLFNILKKMLTYTNFNSVISLAVEQINEKSMETISEPENKKILISLLLNLVFHNDSVLLRLVKKCFKRIELKYYYIANYLDVCFETKTYSETTPKLKKLKVEKLPLDVDRIKLVLEMVLLSKNVDDSKEMCTLLCGILSRLTSEPVNNADYCAQVILTLLSKLVNSWKNRKNKYENCINIESLVQCLRSTTNVQTQQHVLLVMADISAIFPDELLHNIVSVFTFMGNSFIQKDDAFSFQVMTKLIDVALLAVNQLPQGSPQMENILLNILKVFVDARNHVPYHRLMPLFKKLVSHDVYNYTWKLVILIIDSNVRQRSSAKTNQYSNNDVNSLQNMEFDIILVLFSHFSIEIQLATMIKMTTFLDTFMQILVDKKSCPISVVDDGIRNFPHLCRLLIFYVNKVILSISCGTDFISGFLNTENDKSNDEMKTDKLFNDLVNHYVLHMLNTIKIQKSINSDPLYDKYFPSLLKVIHSTLDKFNYLMPPQLFIDVIKNLLNNDMASMQCKGLELMNSKLLQIDHNPSAKKLFECSLKLVPIIMNLISSKRNELKQDNWNYQKQISFINLKILCRYYGNDNLESFIQLHKLIIDILKKHKETNLAVIDSSLMCLADLISVMKNNFVPNLKIVIVTFLQLFKSEQILRSPVSVNCLLLVVNKFVNHLGQFLSPYLNDILQMLSLIFIQAESKHWNDRLLNVIVLISKNIDCRIILPNIVKSYKEMINTNQRGLLMLFILFHYLMKNSTKETLTSNLKLVVEILCLFMNIRVDASTLTMEDLNEIELTYTKAVLIFIVHLSEVTFRPIFQKLFNLVDENIDRTLTFYHLVLGLAQTLKSIFNIFATCLLKQMNDLLDNCKSQNFEVKYNMLVKYILDTISECYLHDIDGSFSSGANDILFQSIINQFENFHKDNELHNDLVSQHVIPCIFNMMQSIKDNDHLFNLHRMICQKTKHDNFKIRLMAVKTLKTIVDGLGGSYETLFPECAPYLAELLEDDSEDVIKECQDLKKSLAKVIGDLENVL